MSVSAQGHEKIESNSASGLQKELDRLSGRRAGGWSGDCSTAQGGIDSDISESMADLKEPSSNFWGQGPLSQRQAKAGHLLRGLEGQGEWAGEAHSLGEAREGKRS